MFIYFYVIFYFILFFIILIYYVYNKLLKEINKVKKYTEEIYKNEEIHIQTQIQTQIQIIKTYCNDEIKSLKKTNKIQDLKIMIDNTIKNFNKEIEEVNKENALLQSILKKELEKIHELINAHMNVPINSIINPQMNSQLKSINESMNEKLKSINEYLSNLNYDHNEDFNQLKMEIDNNKYMMSCINNTILAEIHKIYGIINHNYNYVIDVRKKIHNRIDISIMTKSSISILVRRILFEYFINSNKIYKQVKNFSLDIFNESTVIFNTLLIELKKRKELSIIDIRFNSLYEKILYEYELLVQLYDKSYIQYDIIEHYWNHLKSFNFSEHETLTIMNLKPINNHIE